MPRQLDGPRLPPATGTAKALVVLCHGYGSNGEDLIALGRYWQPVLPDVAFAAPNAPEPCEMGGGGYQWFGLGSRDPHEIAAGCAHAQEDLEAFCGAELRRLCLGADRLAFVGFSQGTMMSLHTGLRQHVPPLCVLGYSGLLPGADRLATELRARPPVLLIHGDSDMTLPVSSTYAAASTLAALGVPVTFHIRPGLGHSIDEFGLEAGARFLADCLGPSAAGFQPPEVLKR